MNKYFGDIHQNETLCLVSMKDSIRLCDFVERDIVLIDSMRPFQISKINSIDKESFTSASFFSN